MSKQILEELKKDLRMVKGTGNLTVSNISNIVKRSTSKIILELKFNSEINQNIAHDIMDITISTLKELGKDTKENIKVSSEAVLEGTKETLKDLLKNNTQKIEEIYSILSKEVTKDIQESINSAISSAKEILKNKRF